MLRTIRDHLPVVGATMLGLSARVGSVPRSHRRLPAAAAAAAAVLALVLLAAPAGASAAKRCGSLSQHPTSPGIGAGVFYIARSITASGGTSCRTARQVVRTFLRRGVSPDSPRRAGSYLCTVPWAEGPSRATCQSVPDSARRIRFTFDLAGGN